jgi:hypothetical protein
VGDDETPNSFNAFWGWYQGINVLAENKIWQIDYVTSLSLVACLNHLSYLMDLNKETERITKQQNN